MQKQAFCIIYISGVAAYIKWHLCCLNKLKIIANFDKGLINISPLFFAQISNHEDKLQGHISGSGSID